MERLPENGFIRVPRFMGVMSNASGLSIRALPMDLPATFSVGMTPISGGVRLGRHKKVDVFWGAIPFGGVNVKTVFS